MAHFAAQLRAFLPSPRVLTASALAVGAATSSSLAPSPSPFVSSFIPSLPKAFAKERNSRPVGSVPAGLASTGSASASSTGPVMAGAVDTAAATASSSTALPDLMTEFLVDMKCGGCEKSVRENLEPLEGVKSVGISLESQVVRVLGSCTLAELEEGLRRSGRKARLIGQGDPSQLTLTAAVAEFKGPVVFGVVRFAQVSMESVRIEAQFDSLSPSCQHKWGVNSYGDLTRGVESTGGVYDGVQGEGAAAAAAAAAENSPPAGDLGWLQTDDKGHAAVATTSTQLKVWDLIGRAVAVYDSADSCHGLAAAVIARSAGVGQNYKSICLCDGTVIWEATPNDYVVQKQ